MTRTLSLTQNGNQAPYASDLEITEAGTTECIRLSGIDTDWLTLQAKFTIGTGAGTVTALVDTSFDGGSTWTNIARFEFDTANARELLTVTRNLAILSPFTPVDLVAPGAINGLIGAQLRARVVVTLDDPDVPYADSTVLSLRATVQ